MTDRKERPEDQPLPIVNDSSDIQSMVISDIVKRRELGIQRYGTALQAHNGRDMLQDAYEEAIDLAIYLRGCIEERDTSKAKSEEYFTRLAKQQHELFVARTT